jgi:hypothetical protein
VTLLAERRRSMHRHSDEFVAAVVHAAVTEFRRQLAELRRQLADPDTPVGTRITGAGDDARIAEAETIRLVRSGVLPRQLYEATARPADPPYDALPPDQRDEDQLRWFITQALTDHAN